MSSPETIGTNSNVIDRSEAEVKIPVHRRVAAAIGRFATISESGRVEAGVMRTSEAQAAQVEAQYGSDVPNPNLTGDQLNRVEALAAQNIKEVR